MTRINSDLNPRELTRRHLIAEIREITMVPGSLRRSLKARGVDGVLKIVPENFTLNKGHVSFFYDKLRFLQRRFDRLANEMERRGYSPDRSRRVAFDGFDARLYNEWWASETDNNIVRERIALRISEKPHLYEDIDEVSKV